MLTLDAFEEAAAKVKEVTQETKLIESPYFSEISRNRVFFKPENMQRTGAYKVRGAYYKISTLTDEERARGLITASAGNHAQGVAYAAQHYRRQGHRSLCPPPPRSSRSNRTKSYGAEVVLDGRCLRRGLRARAASWRRRTATPSSTPSTTWTSPQARAPSPWRSCKELPTVDYILVPIGGGGLCTGVSTLAKLLNPNIKVIGVEPAGAACMKASLEAGHVVTLPQRQHHRRRHRGARRLATSCSPTSRRTWTTSSPSMTTS